MAKATALALHSLVSTRYPQDALEIIGFSLLARTVRPADLPDLDASVTQGTNLHHALVLAGRHLDRHPEAEPVVLVVTDGEPTAHLEPDGRPIFDYPPDPRTIELTLTEVNRLTRRRATINVFMLDDDPRLVAFVDLVARLNGGRVLAPAPDRLGDYVVSDYLRARRGRRPLIRPVPAHDRRGERPLRAAGLEAGPANIDREPTNISLAPFPAPSVSL